MTNLFKIHPAIGIARVGDSPSDFYLAPEKAGALPIKCDTQGRAILDEQGHEQTIDKFKDAQGRIKRQAARFRVYVYKNENDKHGHELKIGETIEAVSSRGELFKGKVLDISWTVYLANKKSSWYQFKELEGEHGYAPDHPLRNGDISDPDARQKLIIDPGPQSVSYLDPTQRRAEFAQGKNPNYPQSFPPPLQPNSIDTLGEIIASQQNDHNRLVVLGGFGNSGSYKTDFGEPRISQYANNDGWFDDIADGPLTAQITYQPTDEDGQPIQNGQPQTINVDVPAWVIVGYPRYAPEILDIITMDDLVYDVAVRNFDFNPEIYGAPPFDGSGPQPGATPSSKQWNDDYYPYFYRDIWSILTRPNQYQWLMVFDAPAFGADPHSTAAGGEGNFDESIVSIPPYEGEDPEQRKMRASWRRFVYDILRKPGHENQYRADLKDKYNYQPPMMPLLCGDNPLENTLSAKFLRLTDTQLFLLRQWADGKFINEKLEGIETQVADDEPSGVDLDRGVLGNLLGGSFCPGAETSWIMRNPAIYAAAYRIKQAAYTPSQLSLTDNLNSDNITVSQLCQGLEPGDITKYSAVPWQSDFNECSYQDIDVTYESWVNTYFDSTGDPAKSHVAPNIFWWPAHRPMEVFLANGQQVPWSSIPFTNEGDLMMVSAWKTLGFIKYNPDYPKNPILNPQYILVE